jgi:thiamine biosynthesis protein ThiS
MTAISLNGKPTETSADTVAALVAELGFVRGTVLVELNGTALRPEEWPRELATGDVVELLRIVAGG